MPSLRTMIIILVSLLIVIIATLIVNNPWKPPVEKPAELHIDLDFPPLLPGSPVRYMSI
ncbi:MAG: hypothetical protein HA496_01755 [Thaumarchaeota archaeon]|nr:hypothetical protein [Nitrososphaerota archaeon]